MFKYFLFLFFIPVCSSSQEKQIDRLFTAEKDFSGVLLVAEKIANQFITKQLATGNLTINLFYKIPTSLNWLPCLNNSRL